MKVLVQHRENDAFVDVAKVNVWHTEDVNEALEYAFRYTNNIDGSWSMKIGEDANEDVTVLTPLHVMEDGRTLGLRSTSMFDRMTLNDKTYKVSMVGFKEVH